MEIVVAFWSGTGNTAMGAEIIVKAIEAAGKSAKLVPVEDFAAANLKDCPVFAMGCPSMGDEVLEETIMEDFVIEVEQFAAGKKIGLFGSYGWGDGEWMRSWEDRCKAAGMQLAEDSLIINDMPDDDGLEKCKAFGAALAG